MDKFIIVANKIGSSIDNPIDNRMIQGVSMHGAMRVIARNSNRNRTSTSNGNSDGNRNGNFDSNNDGNFNSTKIRLSFGNYHTITITKTNIHRG